jgi:hypothetical protein
MNWNEARIVQIETSNTYRKYEYKELYNTAFLSDPISQPSLEILVCLEKSYRKSDVPAVYPCFISFPSLTVSVVCPISPQRVIVVEDFYS